MDQCFVNLLSTLTSASEVLDGVPANARGLKIEKLYEQIELLERNAALVSRDYDLIYKKYLPDFGKPRLNKEVDLFSENNQMIAQMDYSDPALRDMLFVDKRRLFAKRPKADDYDRFCQAAWMVEQICHIKARQLQAYIDACQLNMPESLKQIAETYDNVLRNRSGDESEWSSYPNRVLGANEVYVGDMIVPVDDLELKGLEQMGLIEVHSDEEAWLKLPCSYNVNDSFSLFISYEGDVKKGIEQTGNMLRSIIYQIIRATPSYSCQFVYLDPALGGSTLQELGSALQKAVDGNAFRLHESLYPDHVFRMFRVGTSNDEVSELLKEQDLRVGRINSVCGASTVTQFNAGKFGDDGLIKDGCNDVIPHQVIIFENVHNNLTDSQAKTLRKLADTAKKCGISLIVTSVRNKNEALTDEEQLLIHNHPRVFDKINIDPAGADIELSAGVLGDDPDKALFFNFTPDLAPVCHADYLESVRMQFTPDLNVDTMMHHQIDLHQEFGKYYAGSEIVVPVAINDRNQVVTLGIGKTDGTHFLLSGTTNCGKSSYLHTIINGIIMRYKPTDVQMWLWDFKLAEFERYARLNPPHITCVGSSTTMERTFGFLDLIFAEYRRRQALFSASGVVDMESYRKINGPDSMPRLLIIIDEFHVMSNHVKENEEYKNKLTALFKEMRYVGMLFLLSDQTCSVGLNGLTEDARKQIRGRMAMLNDNEEYNAVFGISNSRDVIPTQSIYEITISRTGKRVDEYGRPENYVYYEHCKTLFIPSEIRDQLSQMSIDAYGAPVDPKVISDPKRGPAAWKEIRLEAQQAAYDSDDDEDELPVPVYLGTPSTMEKFFHFDLVKNYGENVISVVTDQHIHASMLVHEVESVRMSKDYEIYVIARKQDTILKLCRRWLKEQAAADPNMHLVTDPGEICSTIMSLYDTMIKRRKRPGGKKIFIFWLGIYDIVREMEYYPNNRPVPREKKPDPNAAALDDLNSLFGELFGPIAGADVPAGSAEVESDDEDIDDRLYNAAEDIAGLIADGPNCSMHHFVLYSAVSLAKKNRKIVSLDHNNHRIALNIGKDDAVEIVGTTRNILMADGKPMPNHMAVYYDGLRATQFLPFTFEISGVTL